MSSSSLPIGTQAYELATLTGTQLLLLVVSETGIVYTFTTPNLQPIVSEDPGKSLISSCLNEGGTEIQIEHEDPEEEFPANPVGLPEDNNDLTKLSSNQPASSSRTEVHLSQPMSEAFSGDNHAGRLSTPFTSNTPMPYLQESSEPLSQPYNQLFLSSSGMQNMYSNLGQPMGMSSSDSLSTMLNLQICPPGPPMLNLPENPSIFPIDGFMPIGDPGESRKIKRRRTETDLRQRATAPDQRTVSPALPSQYPFDAQQDWLETPDSMKLQNLPGNRSSIFGPAVFDTAVTSFLIRECGHFTGAVDVEPATRSRQSHLEKNINLFLDACDHYRLGESSSTSRKWRQELFPRKQVLAGCFKFFFEEYLPLIRPFPIEGLTPCCEDLQKLVQFVAYFYEEPEQVITELCEIIKNSSGAYMQCILRVGQASTSTQGASPVPSSYSTRLKCAPKLKPRKGVNVTLRGGRLQTVLDEYTDWCRKNKASWSGHTPNSHVKGWFKIDRVRRTFCCCALIGNTPTEGISGVLKIRFPASAIKLIRKEDKLELEVEQADDGSEWNIFNYFSCELFPGDEQDEEEPLLIPSEGAVDSAFLQKICKEKKLSLVDAQRWLENQRSMKLYIEAGDFEDDGFESKVPPKGGKQAFRVKKPSITGSKTSDSHLFELEDFVNIKPGNSPH